MQIDNSEQKAIELIFYDALSRYMQHTREQHKYGSDLFYATRSSWFSQGIKQDLLQAYRYLSDRSYHLEAYCLLRLGFGELRTEDLLELMSEHRELSEKAIRTELEEKHRLELEEAFISTHYDEEIDGSNAHHISLDTFEHQIDIPF